MEGQPLLHRGFERENPSVMKSRHLRTTQPLSRGQADSGHQDSLSLTTFGSSPFILGCVLGTEVEGLEFVRGRFQLDAGLLGAIRLLSHHVSLQVDPT